ncbi:MBL fold metallo-hydrolase [Pseudomonas sp. NPDC089547]|uniref:MBL fold metallo-hydrolase n=1 Tax=Pseudomonas sp. NPDC089547 TaxID=3390652 RepID=UPI003D063167
MDKLVALPITGESFLLLRDGKVILVDGGYNSRSLIAAIEKTCPGLNHIDIVVCTHSDQDHAGGLEYISEYFVGTIGEFWLPGIWSGIIRKLKNNPGEVFEGISQEINEVFERLDLDVIWSQEDIKSTLETLAVEQRRHKDSEGRAQVDGDAIKQEPNTDRFFNIGRYPRRFDGWAWGMVQGARREVYKARAIGKIGRGAADYWLSLINSAKIIWSIAAQAEMYGTRIRLFDFEGFRSTRIASGGEPGLLVPLNAVESIPQISDLTYLALLSPVNQECLTFISPPNLNGFGVIFCGDSPLGDGKEYKNSFLTTLPDPDVTYIVTAPHHGSESNRMAYEHIYEHLENVLWLRSGGSIKQPGSTFKNLDPAVRACTHCPQLDIKRQSVVIPLSRSAPFSRIYSRECKCI